MSALTYKALGVLVRHQLGLPNSARLGLQVLVNPTLKQLARDCALDRSLRRYVLTPPATTTVALDASGVADLSSLVTSSKIILDRLEFGEITHPDYELPLEFSTTDIAELDSDLDELFPQCWLIGDQLHTKGTGADPLAGSLSLAVPRIPTLAQLHEALEPKLIDMIAERVRAGRNVRTSEDNQ
jgi:hypothetical protein